MAELFDRTCVEMTLLCDSELHDTKGFRKLDAQKEKLAFKIEPEPFFL